LPELIEIESIYQKYLSLGTLSYQIQEENTELPTAHSNSNLFQNVLYIYQRVWKILRLELWPQFCQSSAFADFVQEKKNQIKASAEHRQSHLRRLSVSSLFKKSLGEGFLIQVPKEEEFKRFKSKDQNHFRMLDYVVIVSGSYTKLNEFWLFDAEIVKTFPEKPHADVKLPEHLPLFCFPDKSGKKFDEHEISRMVSDQSRLFNFVFNVDGIQFYGACLQCPELNLECLDHENARGSSAGEFRAYAICLITRAPLVMHLRNALTKVSKLPNTVRLLHSEPFIELLRKLDVPFQASFSKTSVEQKSEYISSLKICDFDASILFKTIHPYKILSILEYILLEKKVLLISNQLSVIFFACSILI
jgi:hypothetical protein